MDTLKCSRCSVLLTEDNHHTVCSSDDNIIEYWQCEQCDHIEYGPHEPCICNNINTADSVCGVSSKDQPSENLSRNNTMTFTRENKSPAASPSSPTEADGSSDQTKEDSDAESGSVRSINVFSSTMHLSSIDDAELKEMRRVIMGRPCICGGGQTRSVRDTNDGRHLGQYCSICDKLTGIDDSMDMDDLTFLLETGHVRSVACSGCGNDDPNKVTLENVEFTWTFVCSICYLKLDIPSEDPHRHSSPPDGALAHSNDSLHTRNAYTTDPHDSAPPAACNACNNTDLDLLQVGIDYLSKQIKYIKCLICETTDYLCPGGKYATAGCNDKEKHNSEKERIYSSAYLSPGDHICWHQTLAYWHHGIVIDVSDVDEKMVRVIQYTGPIKGGPPKFVNGEITEDWQRIDGRKEELYRVNYEAGVSYAPEEVIRRARSRRSEQEYNLVQKNCEHFARWCKTGKEESIQVDSFKNVLYNSTKVAGKWLTKGLIDLMNPKNAAKFTFSDAKCLISSEAAASAPLIALEVFNCYRDLSHEYQRYADGDQKGVEFVKICLKRGSQALGGIGGSIAGGVIGTICMPLVGGLAGRTLGYLVGAYVGAFLGKQLGKIVDRNECVNVGREWRKHQPRRRRRVLQPKETTH